MHASLDFFCKSSFRRYKSILALHSRYSLGRLLKIGMYVSFCKPKGVVPAAEEAIALVVEVGPEVVVERVQEVVGEDDVGLIQIPGRTGRSG